MLSLSSSPASGFVLAGLHVLGSNRLRVLVLGFLAAHLGVTAAGRSAPRLPRRGRRFRLSSPSSSSPASSGSSSLGSSAAARSRSSSNRRDSFAKAAWSSSVSASASSSAAGFLLDPRRDELETGCGRRRRRFAGQPLARDQADRGASGTSSAVRARMIASPRTRASVSCARLSRTPAHGARAERFDAAVSSASNTARASRSTGARAGMQRGS